LTGARPGSPGRQVVAVETRGHGRTASVERSLMAENLVRDR